ncbi:MAG: alpha/beta-type small acid-soluble spore protein [Clostridiales bacterium]|jgi:hypothetical protein|nr:alpha/beta-type small acid-soluble spore protein [Clostridiales bacterium]
MTKRKEQTGPVEIKYEKPKPKKNPKPLTENDIMKYEIAGELGLLDKVNETGWKSLTARESGRIGGLMTKRKREQKKNGAGEEQ